METAPPEPAPTYLQLRDRILKLEPDELGFTPSVGGQVWGVVMEAGYEAGTATLVVLADGTTSLYYSTGGGMLGSPGYLPVAQAAKVMVSLANNFIDQMSRVKKVNLPSVGQVNFTLLTYSGKYFTNAPLESLASGDHALSHLYQSGRETLKQLSVLKDYKRI